MKTLSIVILLLGTSLSWAGVCGSTSTGLVTPSSYTPDSTAVLPAVGSSYTGQFGCSAQRLIGDATNGYVPHEYTPSAFSDNDTWVLVNPGGGGNFTVLKVADNSVQCSGVAAISPRWAKVGAAPGDGENIFYYVTGNSGNFMKYNVNTCSGTAYHDLSAIYSSPANSLSFCGGQSDLSNDGDHICISGSNGSGSYAYGERVYQISTNTYGAAINCNGNSACTINNTKMPGHIRPSNNNLVTETNATGYQYMEEFDRATGVYLQRIWWESHATIGVDQNGDDVLYLNNALEGAACTVACSEFPASPSGCGYESLLKVRISDRQLTCILKGGDNTSTGAAIDGHYSGFNVGHRHDYVAIDVEDQNQSDQPTSNTWFPYTNEVILCKNDGSGCYRMIHHLSRRVENYFNQPRLSMSRSAKYIVYDSNFGQGSGCGDCDWSVYMLATGVGSIVPTARFVGAHTIGGGRTLQ